MRKFARAVVVSALAIGAVSACRGDITNPRVETPGDFFVEIEGHKDTTAVGEAFFYPTVEDGSEVLTLLLVTQGAKFQLSFAIRDYDGTESQHDVSLDPQKYTGSYYYSGNGERVTYEIVGGIIDLEDVQRLTIEGEFNFEAVAVDGPNEGSIGRIQGTFRAVCDGECVGGGPPPGS